MGLAVGVNEKINPSVLTNTTGASSSSSASDLQSNFLTLLVTQLKNQDPTNPMENNELTTQLAQINTVSGIEKLNTTLGSISGQINSNQSMQASTLIGHGVMVPGTQILAGKGQATPFGVDLTRANFFGFTRFVFRFGLTDTEHRDQARSFQNGEFFRNKFIALFMVSTTF